MQKSEKKRVCMKPVCERMAQVTPIIFHIDVNSAYLSWTAVEQLKNGAKVDIREIPAIIGGASARENLLRMPFVSVRIS